jgi:hypothetical protein
MRNWLLGLSNAAPEWQARILNRQMEIGGGLSTRGACSAVPRVPLANLRR